MKTKYYLMGYSIGLVLLAGILFIGCKKEDKVVAAPAQAHFTGTVNQLYSITANPPPAYKVTVGTTDVASVDRTVTFTVTSPTGAVAGTHYTLSGVSGNTLVIPAGKATADINVQGIFAPYNAGRKDTLIFKLSGPSIDPAEFSNTVKLFLRGPCFDGDVTDVTIMNGDYPNTIEVGFAPYNSTITGLVHPATGTTSTGKIDNLYGSFGPLTINFNWTDPLNPTVSIPLQQTDLEYDPGQPFLVRTSPGQLNKFSVCNQTLTLTIDVIVDNYPAPGSSAYYERNYRITMAR